MDQSQINGPNGFAFDHNDWAQNLNVDQVDPAAYYFDSTGSATVGQQGYGIPAQSSVTYGQTQAHLGGYNPGYQPQTIHGFDQYQTFAPSGSIQQNTALQGSHHVLGTTHLNGYSQSYDAGHGVSPATSHNPYAAPRVASPYLQQPAGGLGMDGYDDPRPSSNGYPQQHPSSQLVHAQAQQQLAQQQHAQQQHVQEQPAQKQPAQQQRAPARKQHVAAPAYQVQQVGPQATTTMQQHQPVQSAAQSSATPYVSSNTPSTTAQIASHVQQPQNGLAVPDSRLRATASAVAPDPNDSKRWTGMHNAFISATPEKQSDRLANERLLPVFARTERRRLFSERPLLIPAEAMGRYMDSLKTIARDDPQAGLKHRTRRLALEYDLLRVRSLDREALDSFDKIPKSGPSKFQAEARRRGFEYPPLASEASLSALEYLEMRTAAMLDLPTSWDISPVLIQQVAADFAEFLAQVVKELRGTAEYKKLFDLIKSSKGKDELSAGETADINEQRALVDKGRERVRRVVATALRVADDRVLANVNPGRLSQPFQALLNMHNTGDINAPLTKTLLEFVGRLPFLDDSLVEAYSLHRLLRKLEDGGDVEVRTAVRRIRDIVKSNEGKPATLPKVSGTPAANGESAPKTTSAKPRAVKGSAGTQRPKRPLKEEDDSEGRVTKKLATEQRAPAEPRASTSQPSTLQASLSQSQRTTTAQVKPASTSNSNTLTARASTGPLPGKSRLPPKLAAELSKPLVNNTSKSSSISKPPSISKPSSTEPSKMPSKRNPEDKKPEASRPSSGFAALMSEIEQPKAITVTRPAPKPDKKEETRKNETAEERERRLRREARRRLNLSVRWKQELTDVRIYHMEEVEKDERDDNRTRDANDDKAEGRLLKASRSSQIATDREWEEPTLIDFTVIPEEQRLKTFVTRGGHIKVETEEQKVMAKKERTEVMVVYTDSADIPASASSPRPETELDLGPSGVVVAGDSNAASRAALFMAFGARGGLEQLLKRKVSANTSTAAMIVSKVRAAAHNQNYDDPRVRKANDEQVLQALNSASARSYIDPEPVHPQMSKIRRTYADAAVQAASMSIESIVAEHSGLPAPPQEPPKWQQDPARREEWITGFNNDKRAEEATRLAAQQSAMLAQSFNQQPPAQQHPVQQQNPYAQFYQQFQAPQGATQQQPAQDAMAATLAALQSATAQSGQGAPAQPDPLQAFMAAFGNQQQAPAVDPNQALQLAMWAAASGGQQQGQQFGATAPTVYGQDNDQHDDGGEHRNRGRRGGNDGASRDDDHLRGINRSLIGTKPCTFWARGNCNRGDKCTFRHG